MPTTASTDSPPLVGQVCGLRTRQRLLPTGPPPHSSPSTRGPSTLPTHLPRGGQGQYEQERGSEGRQEQGRYWCQTGNGEPHPQRDRSEKGAGRRRKGERRRGGAGGEQGRAKEVGTEQGHTWTRRVTPPPTRPSGDTCKGSVRVAPEKEPGSCKGPAASTQSSRQAAR